MFDASFLDKFMPLELKKFKVQEFTNLKQSNIRIKEYSLNFTQFKKYTPAMVVYFRARMSKCVSGVTANMVKVFRSAMLVKEMEIS